MEQNEKEKLITPIPASQSISIAYNLPTDQVVSINLYDYTGRLVKKLFTGLETKGTHNRNFDISGIASGLYLIKFQKSDQTDTRKIIISH